MLQRPCTPMEASLCGPPYEKAYAIHTMQHRWTANATTDYCWRNTDPGLAPAKPRSRLFSWCLGCWIWPYRRQCSRPAHGGNPNCRCSQRLCRQRDAHQRVKKPQSLTTGGQIVHPQIMDAMMRQPGIRDGRELCSSLRAARGGKAPAPTAGPYRLSYAALQLTPASTRERHIFDR